MLTQVLAAHGATAQLLETRAVAAGNIKRLELDSVHSVVIGYLNRDSVAQARYVVRRLKRARARCASASCSLACPPTSSTRPGSAKQSDATSSRDR